MKALNFNKNLIIYTIFFSLLILLSNIAHALVDYTDTEEFSAPSRKVQKRAPRITKRSAPRRRSSSGGKKYFEFASVFSNAKYVAAEREGKVDRVDLNMRINTDYKFFVDLSYPMYSGKISDDQTDTSFQAGNPKMLIGLNWFQFGSSADALAIDFLGGVSFKGKSEFAAKRTDKHVGISTSKRIQQVGLTLGYNYTFTGSPDEVDASDIGNIQSLYAEIGVIVSSDILFMLRAENFTIGASDDDGRALRLENDIKYSVIKPQMKLRMSQAVDLVMEASFRMRRPKSEELSTSLGVWDLNSAYGNTLGAGLNISI